MTKLTVVIDDQKWPKVRMVATREGITGQPTSTVSESTYDTAYTVFENVLHNHLRPMVQEVNDRRLGTRR